MVHLRLSLSAALLSAFLQFTLGLATLQAGAASAQAELATRRLIVDEITRSYELFVPPEPGGALPLLMVLHGRGGSGAGMASAAGFDDLPGVIVAYPNGLDSQWNYLTGVGNNPGVDDVRFLHRVVEEISAEHPVDASRVYVAGYSNGGFMVQRLACEADSPFGAFASVAAAGFGGMPQVCDEPRPLSMMLVHGTADEVVPWAGQTSVIAGREILLSASVPQTFGFWANFASCGGASERRTIPLPGPQPERVEVLRVTDCPAGEEVVLYALVRGGHAWPRIPASDGNGTGFDAGRQILGFFGLRSDEEF